MVTLKRIVCLANSRKLSERCIAGKELTGNTVGTWVRPVSARQHGEVSKHERQYKDGSDPQVLDIISVSLLDPQPTDFQQENWLLNPDCCWEKVGRATWSDLTQLVDRVEPLWIDGIRTYNGLNDTIPLSQAGQIRSSLRLLHVSALAVSVFSPGKDFGNPKRRVQGRFEYAGTSYHLWLTDSVYESAFLSIPDGEYKLGESFLTVSLGEPHNGACYKLIAAVIEHDGGTRP